ncbi:MAG: cation:proton antiporter [Bacteroidales bacterium]|nr:cation:proton antiporter [Candidatus Cacconaster equifaecalis]
MSSELTLVTQLAIILISAGLFTVIFKALKQPLILGYIVAGFIVGPHLGLVQQFSPESVHQWSELGIIFLLFGLGLEFNFKKLLNVGSAAIIAAITICIGMFVTGYTLGTVMEWTKMECIFLGGMLSMSSTTIIIKAYDDLGLKNERYAPLVFGLLVVEDLLAVLMMVLFSTIAVSNKFSGTDMLLSLGKLVLFLVVSFLIGIFALPTLLKKANKYLSDEILLLISVGLCFIMVVLANSVGFSSALGAFLIGSILSSTTEGEHIERITVSLKNLFGAIFFVSVGMMVDPVVIFQYWKVILAITLVAMAGILIFSTTGVLFAGRGLDTAIHVGFSLPQLGEFSFIIAGMGCSLGVLRDFIYPSIIAVSVITTFTTPYMIKAANPVSRWFHKKMPQKFIDRQSLKSEISNLTNMAEKNDWAVFIKKYLRRVALYSMLIIVLIIGLNKAMPMLNARIFSDPESMTCKIVDVIVTLAVIFPLLYGLAVNGDDLKSLAQILVRKDSRSKIPVLASIILRVFMAVEFAVFAIMPYLKLSGWELALMFAGLFLVFFIARRVSLRFTGLEDMFIANLHAKEEYDKSKAPVTTAIKARMENYNVFIENCKVSSDFSYAGKSLREMPFRHTSGVNIIKIQRGTKSILIPKGEELILPGDLLLAVGTRQQLDNFISQMKECSQPGTGGESDFDVRTITLYEKSELTGMRLGDTNMRHSGCMVISVMRNGLLETNPDKNFTFQSGDIIWMAGLKESLDWYSK